MSRSKPKHHGKRGHYPKPKSTPMLDALEGRQHKQANLDTRRMRHGIVNTSALAVGGSSSKRIKRIGSVTLSSVRLPADAPVERVVELVQAKLAKLRDKAKRKLGGVQVSRSRTFRKDKAKPAFTARAVVKRRKVFDTL